MRKLKVSFLLVILIAIFTSNYSIAQTPGDAQHNIPEKEYARGCYKFKWEGVKPYYCEGEEINISLKLEWDPICIVNSDCYGDYTQHFDLDGVYHTGNIGLEVENNFTIAELDEGDHTIKFEVLKDCIWSGNVETIISTSIKIKVIKPGGTYSILVDMNEFKKSNPKCDELLEDKEFVKEFAACCGEKITAQTKFEFSESTVTAGHYDVSLGFSLGGAFKYLPVDGIFSAQKGWSQDDIKTVINSVTYYKTNTWGGDANCQIPAVSILYAVYERQTYQTDCDPTTDDILVEVEEIFVPVKFIFETCDFNFDDFDECISVPVPNINDNKNFIPLANCSGTISTMFPSGFDIDGLTFEWTSPSGEKFDTKDIDYTEYGLYTLTVKDRCCNTYTYTHNVCKAVITTDWEYDEDKIQYCRMVNCVGDPPGIIFTGCDGSEYEECVTPKYGDWIFDDSDKKCKQDVWINGEVIPYLEKQKASIIIEEYDDFFKRCKLTYYCEEGEDLKFTEEKKATFGDWKYDGDEDLDEDCYRDIFCQDTPVEDKLDEIDAEIQWGFDDWSEECEGRIYCDDSETEYEFDVDAEFDDISYDKDDEECTAATIICNGDELDEDYEFSPYEIGDWDENCDRIILCINGGEEFEQSGYPLWELIEINSSECDDSTPDLYALKCNGEDTDLEICFDGNPNFKPDDNQLVDNSHYTIIKAHNSFKISTNDNDHINKARLFLFDYLGRLIITKNMDFSQRKVYKVDDLNNRSVDILGFGIYHIVIIEYGKIAHTEKIYITM